MGERACILEEKRQEEPYSPVSSGNIQNPRALEGVNNPERLYSGDIRVYPYSDYREELTIKIEQPYPLPLTVTSISIDIDVEDKGNG